ncbi:MAG: ribonuclease Y [Acidobacteriota bacterium]|nr:ribonuclease Y [Acidobacteriota bacterium]MDH3783867.1 ribonuclease Y [Acidobacteriota bacterium]
MQQEFVIVAPIVLGSLAGIIAAVVGGLRARRVLAAAAEHRDQLLREAEQEALARRKEIEVEAQEKAMSRQEDFDRLERELEERQAQSEQRTRKLEREGSELGRQRKDAERMQARIETKDSERTRLLALAETQQKDSQTTLERIAGLSADEARLELVEQIEEEARSEAARRARKTEDEARRSAEREAVNLMVQASQRVNIQDVVETTVSFFELPSDEMKGRIIGREGRNIRALEMATGIDLIVDDTPRSIIISSFDPVRREVARISIERLVADGRIHPARIEEVVAKVGEDFDERVLEHGNDAAYSMGISDIHPRLASRLGQMRYHTAHGQNLMHHCRETGLIAGFMALEIAADAATCQRAGLLHGIGQVDDSETNHPLLAAADIAERHGEDAAVVHAIRSLHGDVEPRSMEALLVRTAKRMSDNRPGAHKENLAVFIERLRRLEELATRHEFVDRAYAVKAGKEIRVLVDAKNCSDQQTFALCKQIAGEVEKEINYPGQIKIIAIRESRAVRFAV